MSVTVKGCTNDRYSEQLCPLRRTFIKAKVSQTIPADKGLREEPDSVGGDMNLKSQLRWFLKEQRLTASDLARQAGIRRQVISDWMVGK